MSTAEIIAARREAIAILVEKPKGLTLPDLVATMQRRVEGLTTAEARKVITALSSSGPGRDPAVLYRDHGRYRTRCKSAPPAIKVTTAPPDPMPVQPEAPEPRFRHRYAEDVLAYFTKQVRWVSPREVRKAIGESSGIARGAILELHQQGLLVQSGAGRGSVYALAEHNLGPHVSVRDQRTPRLALIKQAASKPGKPAGKALFSLRAHLRQELAEAEKRATTLRAALADLDNIAEAA